MAWSSQSSWGCGLVGPELPLPLVQGHRLALLVLGPGHLGTTACGGGAWSCCPCWWGLGSWGLLILGMRLS